MREGDLGKRRGEGRDEGVRRKREEQREGGGGRQREGIRESVGEGASGKRSLQGREEERG